MNKNLIVQRKTEVPDGMGGFEASWVNIGYTAARISPTSAATRAQYNQLGIGASHTVFVPPRANVHEGDRLVYGSRVLKVNGITDPSEARHHLELVCEEVRG